MAEGREESDSLSIGFALSQFSIRGTEFKLVVYRLMSNIFNNIEKESSLSSEEIVRRYVLNAHVINISEGVSFFKTKHDLYETSNETVKHQSLQIPDVGSSPVGRVINYFSCAQGEISTIIEAGKKTDFRR